MTRPEHARTTSSDSSEANHRRVALVTGGALRVGRAICLELAQHHLDVAIHYNRSNAEARKLQNEIDALGSRSILVQGDLNDESVPPSLVEKTVDRFGRLDVLVNSASMFHVEGTRDKDSVKPSGEVQHATDTLETVSYDLWTNMLRVNLMAPALLAKWAAPHLSKTSSGKIINLCDICVDRPWTSHMAYCASKSGLVSLTRSLAKSLAPNIQVNGVSPGIAIFPETYSTEMKEHLISKVPAHRVGTPEEIAHVVQFLADAPGYLTGQIVAVDGGLSLV